MYKLVLFDFDGTVFDTGEGVMKCAQYAAEAFGYEEPDYKAFRGFVGPPLLRSFMSRYNVDEETGKAMIDKYRERYNGVGLTEAFLYPGVVELVRELRAAGKTVAVATGKPTGATREILKNNGLSDLFDDVLGSSLDGKRSEKWQIIEVLLEKFGREDVVMIGDRDNDVLGAKTCGIPCIGVSWGYAEPDELMNAGAICLVNNTQELKNILLG